MLAEHSSILNGGADDLEVRGDEAIKRLFAKYDTFLFDVSLLALFGGAVFFRKAKARLLPTLPYRLTLCTPCSATG
jgi:hypothetical protein